jgi:hypothetical protein
MTIALFGAGVLAGCVDSPEIEGPPPPGALVSPRQAWRAYGDLRDPGKAIDGDPATAAVSGNPSTNAHIEVDLGKACLFNRIIIQHGLDEYAFPNRMAVYTSMDGQSFQLQCEAPGKRRVTNALLISPVLARYVRLVAVSPGSRPWSVAEIIIH